MKSKFRSRLIGAMMALGIGALAFASSTGTAQADPYLVTAFINHGFENCMHENGVYKHVDQEACPATNNLQYSWGTLDIDSVAHHVHSNNGGGCLSVAGGGVHINAVVATEPCDAARPDQKWVGSELEDWPGMCMQAMYGGWVTIQYCDGSSFQSWEFDQL